MTDDAAFLTFDPKNHHLILTQDALNEGIHFFRSDPVSMIAKKSLRVNISDLIAKGAKPILYSMALGVPDYWEEEDIMKFAQGLEADHKRYNLSLTGGDTYRSPGGLCVSITMFGTPLKEERYVTRSGAMVGDLIMITGTVGDAALGLKVALGELSISVSDDAFLLDRYRLPRPPFSVNSIVNRFATASIDISDGLIGDCSKLAVNSGVLARIDRDRIPLSKSAQRVIEDDHEFWNTICGGGDDYQTLFCINHRDVDLCRREAQEMGVDVTSIGEIIEGTPGSFLLMSEGVPISISLQSYKHF
ncbi:thiamine-phosphate kinase [Candidatus Endowatersipora endosymbiont of Watersipora subatra]|uniref:thiamine-phosphate kinase n=1 Tax=Candidatus Endowatersipora endosymbiont of Watersipora subatra TaxID=3077946 RepID=UPI00312C75C3